jgi:hypothetical protein
MERMDEALRLPSRSDEGAAASPSPAASGWSTPT